MNGAPSCPPPGVCPGGYLVGGSMEAGYRGLAQEQSALPSRLFGRVEILSIKRN